MIRNLLVLPNGKRISSGADQTSAIISVTLTEMVNNGTDLTLGSTCSAMLEVKLISPAQELNISGGEDVELYQSENGGEWEKIGVFRMEMPTYPTAGTIKLTGYDRVSLLDKDLTEFITGLEDWPYSVFDIAEAVCGACGLTLKNTELLNGGMPVQKFSVDGVTGRQIIQWIGEASGCFARATPDGEIELRRYADSGIRIFPRSCLKNGLSFENYTVEPVTSVQIRAANSEQGYLWPNATGQNPYIITGNPLFQITADTAERLNRILAVIPQNYRPCKLILPASLNPAVGDRIAVEDRNGNTFDALVMSKTITGQKMTLECSGSQRRNSSASANNRTPAKIAAENRLYADAAAKNAVAGQTQAEAWAKLTDNGKMQGMFFLNGEVYVNLAYGVVGKLIGENIDGSTLRIIKGATIAGWNIDENSIYQVGEDGTWANGTFMCTGSEGSYSIGGSPNRKGWALGVGGKFGVGIDGSVWCSDMHITSGTFKSIGSGGHVIMSDGDFFASSSDNKYQLGIITGGNGVSLSLFANNVEVFSFDISGGALYMTCPDSDNYGNSTRHKLAWKTVNGEKMLVAAD